MKIKLCFYALFAFIPVTMAAPGDKADEAGKEFLCFFQKLNKEEALGILKERRKDLPESIFNAAKKIYEEKLRSSSSQELQDKILYYYDKKDIEDFIEKFYTNTSSEEKKKIIDVYDKIKRLSINPPHIEKGEQYFGNDVPLEGRSLGFILTHLGQLESATLYDVGCGIGANLAAYVYAKAITRLVGVDILDSQIEQARDLFRSLPLTASKHIEFSTANLADAATRLVKSDVGKVDVITCFNLLHFLNETQTHTMVKNWARLMKPKGVLFCTMLSLELSPVPGEEPMMPALRSFYMIQEGVGLRDPGLIYMKQMGDANDFRIIPQEQAFISDPSYIKESGTDGTILGRHIFTRKTLLYYLSTYFNIVRWNIFLPSQYIFLMAERK